MICLCRGGKVKVKKRYLKSDIMCDMLLRFLNDLSISRKEAIRDYEISSITFYKYISAIRNMLVDFCYYEYDLIYKKGYYFLKKYP